MFILVWSIIVGIFSCSVSIQAQENKNVEPSFIEEQVFEQLGFLTLLELAPLTREEIIERLKTDLNIHVKSRDLSLFDRYFLSYIYNYFQAMKPDSFPRTAYNLHSLGRPSQQLVSLRSGNNLYFSTNAGHHIITKRFKEIMDSIFNQTFTVLPDEIRMTFEYNNELYAQLNKAVLSSEEIKDFINRHSGIVFSEDSDDEKPFTRDELLIVLRQYLELPVHIRDNLALKRIERVESIVSIWSMFSTILGRYNFVTETIILTDAAFEKENTDDKGEGTFLHEIGHALWGKSIWKGLSREVKTDYTQLSWQEDKRINDEFISDYSATNEEEDFAEHFSAYINDGEKLKHRTPLKYKWFKENIFLNVEYFTSTADHLKIFVESEHEDTTPPYFIDFPYESIQITVRVDQSQADDWRNGDAMIKVEVSNLFDDMSEIESVDILMESKDDYFWLRSPGVFEFCNENTNDETPLDCVLMDPDKPGEYVWYHSQKLFLSYPGDYKMAQVELEDKAGNRTILRSRLEGIVIHFPGTRDRLEKEEAEKKEREQEEREQEEREQEEREQEEREQEEREQEEREQEEREQEEREQEERAGSPAIVEEKNRRKQEVKGFNIINLSDQPARLYQNEEELTTLNFRECINITERERQQLSLEIITDWFDWKLDSVICSNTTDSTTISRCRVQRTSVIKQNENKEYILTDYQNELEADFSQCRLSPAETEKARRKKEAQEAKGFNIINLSDRFVGIYQDQKAVLALEPQKCISINEKELLALTLKKVGGGSNKEAFICSNVANPLNIDKCNVTAVSLVKKENEEYILTDYQNEWEADFGQCRPLNSNGDLASGKDTALSKSASEEEQDSRCPYIINRSDETYFISVVEYTEDHAVIKVEVNGLVDDEDMSEIKNIDINMCSETDCFWLRSPSRLCQLKRENIDVHYTTCLFIDPNKPGYYMYYVSVSRNDSHPGHYIINQVELEDKAENRCQGPRQRSDNNSFFFEGKQLLWNKAVKREIKKDLEIRASKTVDGDTIAHILTTDMTRFKMYSIYIDIEDTETEQELTFKIDANQLGSLNAQFNSPFVSGKMNLPVVIPRELASGRYKLNRIAFVSTNDNDHYINFGSDSAFYFDHISEGENSIARPVVDDIVMEVLKGENKKGGDTSIKVNVPIEGLDEGSGMIVVIVRTPIGDKMSFSSGFESHFHDSGQNVSAVLNLGPRHTEGEYMITHISTMESYASSVNNRINHSGLRLEAGGYRKHEERLLERGVRTTLSISIPHSNSDQY